MSDDYENWRDEQMAQVLAALADAWRTSPTQRLGQLILNASRDENGSVNDGYTWEVKDSDWVEKLENARW